jgi:N-acetylglucosaminyldiphosphoundecaprenol N-acetyl-beta-D-mannosaminyltransferase
MGGQEVQPSIAKVNVLGVGVSVLNLKDASEIILNAVRTRQKGFVAVTGVHGVSEAQNDPEFRRILNSAFLNTPDGMPMTWVGRLQGFRSIDRVYGPDLMLKICQATQNGEVRHFLYGGAPGVAEALEKALVQRFPGICVCGCYTPPFRPLNTEEEEALKTQLVSCKPDILWVGLSTPKQEKFMAAYHDELTATIMIGVGAAFDILAGRKRQAPRWMQRSGLEWLFRLAQEPRRLWKRYLVNNPLFVLRILAQFTRVRQYSLEPQ